MAGDIRDLCTKLHGELLAKKHKWGFHISYSTKESWSQKADFLVLTLNPQAKDDNGKMKKVEPKEPWPKTNDFFDPKNDFPIKKTIQAILWELALASGGASLSDAKKAEKKAKDFCGDKAVLSSYVPFRTEGEKDIEDWMFDFSDKMWGKILNAWTPRFIVTLGSKPFAAMDELLSKKSKLQKSISNPVSKYGEEKSTLKYSVNTYKNGVTLVGLPHPNARGHKGFPTGFPDDAESPSALRDFFGEIFGKRDAPKKQESKKAKPTKPAPTAGGEKPWEWYLEPRYYFLGRFQENNLAVAAYFDKSHLWYGYLRIAQRIPEGKFDDAGDFSEGLGSVKVGKLWGYVDEKCQWVMKPQFSLAYKFVNGLAGAKTKKTFGLFGQEKFGYINKNGDWVIKPEYDLGFHFGDNGLASVFKGHRMGYINKKGDEVIPFKFQMAFNFRSGIAAAKKFGEKWGFINEKGEWVIEPRFDDVDQFYGIDHCKVKENGHWGLMDCKGKWLIKPKYDDISSSMRAGMATARIGDLWGVIDRNENWLIKPTFEKAFVPSDNGLIPVRTSLWGYIIFS